MRGQFNLAKVLRALAHSQRVQAMSAARLLVAEDDPATVLGTLVTKLESPPSAGAARSPAESPAAPLDGPAARTVRERAQGLCSAPSRVYRVTVTWRSTMSPSSCVAATAVATSSRSHRPGYQITPLAVG
jgi:hypothetical protein